MSTPTTHDHHAATTSDAEGRPGRDRHRGGLRRRLLAAAVAGAGGSPPVGASSHGARERVALARGRARRSVDRSDAVGAPPSSAERHDRVREAAGAWRRLLNPTPRASDHGRVSTP